MKLPLKVLFLCTGNSCRSILGEALANHLGEGRILARSAGSQPTGQVHPRALAVLERHGVPVDAPSSKSMDDLEGERFDVIVTVCDAAAGEACPVWLSDAAKAHWGIPDPALGEGRCEEIVVAVGQMHEHCHQRGVELCGGSLRGGNSIGATPLVLHMGFLRWFACLDVLCYLVA